MLKMVWKKILKMLNYARVLGAVNRRRVTSKGTLIGTTKHLR